jgi:hypothetical protein
MRRFAAPARAKIRNCIGQDYFQATVIGHRAKSVYRPFETTRDFFGSDGIGTELQRFVLTHFRRAGRDRPLENALEHVPEKWVHFSDKDMLQHVELARILFDQAIPPDRNTR